MHAFLGTLTNEILGGKEYSDAPSTQHRLDQLSEAIARLEGASSAAELTEFLTCDRSRELAGLLLRVDEERLPSSDELWLKTLGDWREWAHGQPLRGVVVGLLLAESHESRGRRRRAKFAATVRSVLQAAVERDPLLNLVGPARVEAERSSRTYDFVLRRGEKAMVAVVGIFQTSSGGRQQDIILELPELERAVASADVALLVVADGPGFLSMTGVVERVAPSLTNLTNLADLSAQRVSAAVESATRVDVRGAGDAGARRGAREGGGCRHPNRAMGDTATLGRERAGG